MRIRIVTVYDRAGLIMYHSTEPVEQVAELPPWLDHQVRLGEWTYTEQLAEGVRPMVIGPTQPDWRLLAVQLKQALWGCVARMQDHGIDSPVAEAALDAFEMALITEVEVGPREDPPPEREG